MQRPKPTTKQINLLKRLASETGTSFTYPQTVGEAKAEITRLLDLKKNDPHASIQRSSARRERRQTSLDCHTAIGSASRFRDDEVTGYGSSAQWVYGR